MALTLIILFLVLAVVLRAAMQRLRLARLFGFANDVSRTLHRANRNRTLRM